MILLDVNVLVQLHRTDAEFHQKVTKWMDEVLQRDLSVGVSELVLSGCLRVITHPRVFQVPTNLNLALQFIGDVRSRDEIHIIGPGKRHWPVFTRLCQRYDARGNLVPDAYHAALAIEHGCEWASLDHGFKRFEELKWFNPVRDFE